MAIPFPTKQSGEISIQWLGIDYVIPQNVQTNKMEYMNASCFFFEMFINFQKKHLQDGPDSPIIGANNFIYRDEIPPVKPIDVQPFQGDPMGHSGARGQPTSSNVGYMKAEPMCNKGLGAGAGRHEHKYH